MNMLNSKKIQEPRHHLIEKTAAALATAWYEVGRSQGLKSVHKNARLYANHNLEKFIPRAIEHLIDILGNPDFPKNAKDEIYDALIERVNDPTNITSTEVMNLPMIDIKKLLDMTAPPSQELERKREPIVKILSGTTALSKPNTEFGLIKSIDNPFKEQDDGRTRKTSKS